MAAGGVAVGEGCPACVAADELLKMEYKEQLQIPCTGTMTNSNKVDTEVTEQDEQKWEGDLLDRQQYAKFLSNYINNKCTDGQPGMVMALDAPWGLGKSFFVQRWEKDLKAAGHHTVMFDAWKNDSADDPVISFMAELNIGLEPLHEKKKDGESVGEKLAPKVQAVTKNLRRAIIPVGKVLAKAALKKGLGVAWEEITEAVPSVEETITEYDEAAKDLKEAGEAALNAGLDKFFSQTLQSHTERVRAIDTFRHSLEDLVNSMCNEGVIHRPMYVFIDELDRCRPDYAIRLLEGIKHLFNVNGVVFVVSTNLDQLSKAVGAVYGSSFNGALYLKRFFDIEFELPEPDRLSFIKSVISSSSLNQRTLCSGLEVRHGTKDATTEYAFSKISSAMNLDLRTIQRALVIVDAVAESIPKTEPVCAMWLFFLSASKLLYINELKNFANSGFQDAEFNTLCEIAIKSRIELEGFSTIKDNHGFNRPKMTNYSIRDALTSYQLASKNGNSWILRRLENIDEHSSNFPDFLVLQLFHGWTLHRDQPHPINRYPKLINLAGHLSK